MKTKNILTDVVDSNLCAGCGICAGILPNKINMNIDDKGYLRPIFLEPEINSDENFLLEQVCPGNVIKYEELPKSQPVWGNIKTSTIAFAKNEEVRHKSSSGGVISQLLIYLLDKNEIDEVVHIGVSDENPLLNEIKRSKTKEEVLKNSGSRYSPSAPLASLNELLDDNKRYAIVGKPCDIAALRRYSKFDERVSQKFQYLFSFFCAGIPSMEGTYQLLGKFNVEKDNVSSFKYRGDGWPGLTKIVTKENNVFEMKYDDSWGKVLNRHLQTRCKLCIDGIGEFSDISCGDGWFGDQNGYPSFEESKGRSLVTTRTPKGQKLFERAINEGYLIVEQEVDSKDIEKIQPYQADRRKLLLSRIIAMKIFKKKTPKYPISILIESSRNVKTRKIFRSFIGTIGRIAKGKI